MLCTELQQVVGDAVHTRCFPLIKFPKSNVHSFRIDGRELELFSWGDGCYKGTVGFSWSTALPGKGCVEDFRFLEG